MHRYSICEAVIPELLLRHSAHAMHKHSNNANECDSVSESFATIGLAGGHRG